MEGGAKVIHSIICSGATIKAGAVISRGCVVSYGAVIGEGVVLPEFSRITLKKHVDEVFQLQFLTYGCHFCPVTPLRVYRMSWAPQLTLKL